MISRILSRGCEYVENWYEVLILKDFKKDKHVKNLSKA